MLHREKFGHVDVKHGVDEYKSLYAWMLRQRKLYRSGKLNEDQIALLESLEINWDGNDACWGRQFAKVEAFHAEHGHARVPRRLGAMYRWSQRQRIKFQPVLTGQAGLDSLDDTNRERLLSLQKIGFDW